MLYDLTIRQADNDKNYIVEADNYAQAEQTFQDFAHRYIAGQYTITSIACADNHYRKTSIANDCKVLDLGDTSSSRRIGFNAVNLDRMLMQHTHHIERSDKTIYF